jgi:CRISPR-associated protein Csd2
MADLSLITDPSRRHDFVVLFDVADGNPNGDPDAGNLPRVDPETMHGLVTDVAIKRKVRDFVDVSRGTEQRFKIYVQHGQYLSTGRERVFAEHGADAKTKVAPADAESWMCNEFFDVRMFGAVLPMKGGDSGQVRGPLQLTFSRSIDPIIPLELSIVGPAQNAQQSKRSSDDESSGDNFGTMGRKAVVPYGLYRAHGFFNPHFAKKTGVTNLDLELFWQALQMMWDLDRSAARGMMACRGLYVFTHESDLGNAPAHALFGRIAVPPSTTKAPRDFSDYIVSVDDANLPAGISLTRLVG